MSLNHKSFHSGFNFHLFDLTSAIPAGGKGNHFGKEQLIQLNMFTVSGIFLRIREFRSQTADHSSGTAVGNERDGNNPAFTVFSDGNKRSMSRFCNHRTIDFLGNTGSHRQQIPRKQIGNKVFLCPARRFTRIIPLTLRNERRDIGYILILSGTSDKHQSAAVFHFSQDLFALTGSKFIQIDTAKKDAVIIFLQQFTDIVGNIGFSQQSEIISGIVCRPALRDKERRVKFDIHPFCQFRHFAVGRIRSQTKHPDRAAGDGFSPFDMRSFPGIIKFGKVDRGSFMFFKFFLRNHAVGDLSGSQTERHIEYRQLFTLMGVRTCFNVKKRGKLFEVPVENDLFDGSSGGKM